MYFAFILGIFPDRIEFIPPEDGKKWGSVIPG